jgi:hypothetical protein
MEMPDLMYLQVISQFLLREGIPLRPRLITQRLAISGSIGSSNPSFAVQRTSPTSQGLVSGLFPILNISVTLLTLRAILGNGTITLAGEVELNANDVIGLFYVSDGLSFTLNLGGANAGGIIWSVHRMT